MKQQPSAWGRPHAPALPRWGRKTLSLFLSVVLCLSMLPATALAAEAAHANHPVCGGGTCTDGGSHQSQTWMGISNLSEITKDGYYYLKNNVEITDTWKPVNGVYLCLNGHSITENAGTTDSRVPTITVDESVIFTLTDCATMQGKITHADGKIGCGVLVKANGTFTMYGGSITGNTAAMAGGVSVVGGGKFTMYGGSITENTASDYEGGGVYVSSNRNNNSIGKFIMNGGTITGNSANGTKGNGDGGGVYVTGGEFTMTGGAITGNTANGNGGGVLVYNSGSFIMSSGSITGNTATKNGGGVVVSGSTFEMSGGTIYGNSATSNENTNKGGGVFVTGGSQFIMTKGKIIGNKAVNGGQGGGVFVSNYGNDTFQMQGGIIGGTGTGEANHAYNSGGGVYVAGGTFTMSGTAGITGNTTYGSGGGVYVADGSMNVSGEVQITGNSVSSNANNVYLPNGKTITIVAGLSDTARIGVTKVISGGNSVQIATGATQNVNYTQIFTPDMTGNNYMVTKKNESGAWNLYLGPHEHSWNYTLSEDGKTITATCEGYDVSGGSVTISADNSTYDGTAKAAEALVTANWQGGAVSDISYSKKISGGSSEPLDQPPVNAGTYIASITLGEATASVTYTIAKADPTVTWPSISGTVYVNDDALTNDRLTGGSGAGTFAFAEGATKAWQSAGQKTTSVVFAPTDSANYNSLTKSDVAVNVVKRTVESATEPTAITNKSYGTAESDLGLPENVTITTSENKTFLVPVTWSGYEPSTLVEQKLTGTLDLTRIAGEVQQATTAVTAQIKVKLQPLTLPEITAQGYEGVYDGNAHGITLSGVPEDATVTYGTSQDNCTQNSLTYTGFTNGATTVYYKVSKTGYTDVIGSATVKITKKTVTITAEDKTAYRGAAIPELTYTVSGLIGEETLTKTPKLSTTADMNTVGEYTIKADGAENSNYDITYVPGKLTVLRRSSSGSPSYSVTTPDQTENGSVTVSPKNAKQGSTVTITVTPDAGYVLGDLGVTDKGGKDVTLTKKSDTQYTFVMPAGQVEVKASFVKDDVGQSDFADVKNGDYFYDAVRWAVEKGVTNGTDATHFSPDASCTRAQIVTFLWRAAGSPEAKGVSGFVDVAEGSYYAKAVAWAVEQGITNGTDATHFSPDASCTRAQSVTFLYRALGQKPSGQAAFADVPAESYYADAVAWAAEKGITNGTGNGRFSPNAVCTRAQIVTFLYRAYQGK